MKTEFSPEVIEAAARVGAIRVDVPAIARRAGVSETTCRRVLRAEPGPTATTVARVLAAAGLMPTKAE